MAAFARKVDSYRVAFKTDTSEIHIRFAETRYRCCDLITRAKRRQGFGCSQGEVRLDIQTLCLQNQPPAGRDFLTCKLPSPPLISIADVKYYNQDFKPGSSFLRGTFLSLFQSKIVLILFCWKQQWVPYVGFLVPSSAVFQGSLCRIPYTGSGGFPGFLM